MKGIGIFMRVWDLCKCIRLQKYIPNSFTCHPTTFIKPMGHDVFMGLSSV